MVLEYTLKNNVRLLHALESLTLLQGLIAVVATTIEIRIKAIIHFAKAMVLSISKNKNN